MSQINRVIGLVCSPMVRETWVQSQVASYQRRYTISACDHLKYHELQLRLPNNFRFSNKAFRQSLSLDFGKYCRYPFFYFIFGVARRFVGFSLNCATHTLYTHDYHINHNCDTNKFTNAKTGRLCCFRYERVY